MDSDGNSFVVRLIVSIIMLSCARLGILQRSRQDTKNLANSTNVFTVSANEQVCAHRYVQNCRLHGKCFFTDGSRTLANFQEYNPCDEGGINVLVMPLFLNNNYTNKKKIHAGTVTLRQRSECQAGISSVTMVSPDAQFYP